jgi:hypothetical protein
MNMLQTALGGVSRHMRSVDAAIALGLACSLALGLGCATGELIHRPPTPAEIETINESTHVIVEPMPMVGPSRRIDHVVSADAATIVVAPKDGPPYALRLDDVMRFSVRHAGPSAAVGAAVGAGAGAASIGLLALAIGGLSDLGPGAPPNSGGGASVGQVALEAALLSGVVGALIGAIVGTRYYFSLGPGPAREYFPYDPGPASPPPPNPPSPGGKTLASVAALSAEVRSAPFNVAPVVVVLARGQRLFVDAAPHEGWRVATLLDGRVGYIQDADVKVDAP